MMFQRSRLISAVITILALLLDPFTSLALAELAVLVLSWRFNPPPFLFGLIVGLVGDVMFGLPLGLSSGLLLTTQLAVFGLKKGLEQFTTILLVVTSLFVQVLFGLLHNELFSLTQLFWAGGLTLLCWWLLTISDWRRGIYLR